MRKRIKTKKTFELQLTSMMDALVIIVVFLLKNYNVSTNSLSNASGLQLPLSISKDIPNDSVEVIITPTSLTVENEKIIEFGQNFQFKPSELDEKDHRIISLYDALIKSKNKTEILLAKSKKREDGKPVPFEGILAIQADKQIRYDLLKKIMYTAGAAGYKVFRFLAMKKET